MKKKQRLSKMQGIQGQSQLQPTWRVEEQILFLEKVLLTMAAYMSLALSDMNHVELTTN